MGDLLFVYGTLRDPDLLAAVLGRPLQAGHQLPAAAPGFVALHYPRRIYPALVRRPGGAAPGLVLTDLSPFEHDLLDAFEGEEDRPTLIPVMLEGEIHEAYAYLPAIEVPANALPWTLETWQATHQPRVLQSERAGANEIRLKLIAIRPH